MPSRAPLVQDALRRLVTPPPGFRHSLPGRLFTALFLVALVLLAKKAHLLERPAEALVQIGAAVAPSLSPLLPVAIDREPPQERIPLQLLLIDEAEYQRDFGGRSPLDRRLLGDRLRQLARQTAAQAGVQGVAIDLDLAPNDEEWPAGGCDAAGNATLSGAAADFCHLHQALAELSERLAGRAGLHLIAPQQACRAGAACAARQWQAAIAARGARFHQAHARSDLFQLTAPAPSPASPSTGAATSLGVGLALAVTGGPAAACGPEPTVHGQASAASACPELGPLLLRSVVPAIPTQDFARLAEAATGRKVLIIGGNYDNRDRHQTPDGRLVPGVELHALAALSAAEHIADAIRLEKSSQRLIVLVLEVLLALVMGLALAKCWVVVRLHHSFACRVGAYGLFLLLALGVPALLLRQAVNLQLLGFDAMTLSALCLGALLDVSLSSQEPLLQDHDHYAGTAAPGHAGSWLSRLDWLALGGWWLIQWAVIATAVLLHFKALPISQLAAALALAATWGAVSWSVVARRWGPELCSLHSPHAPSGAGGSA